MPNTHIFDYLDYYLNLQHAPRYAVLINGPWGCGKTHALKAYLAENADRNKRTTYVSLFGLRSIEDIAVAVLTSLVSKGEGKLAKPLSKAGASMAHALWKRLPVVGNAIEAADIVTLAPCDTFIFDDLERASISKSDAVAYINQLVEHEDRKVIVIANEKEIPSDERESYHRIREKVVGQTLRFRSQPSDVLPIFVEAIEDREAREFLSKKN